MSERKIERDLDEMEPVKFKPLYLIVGICVVVIIILACIIYIYLNNKSDSKKTNTPKEETVVEPTEYVIPKTACQKNLTIQTYDSSVYSSCVEENVVLNFTDVNTIIDTKNSGANFNFKGIYFDKKPIVLDDYLTSGTFKDIKFSVNGQDVIMLVTDALVANKMVIYAINQDKIVYTGGTNTNTLYTLGTTIGYTKYTNEGLQTLDCATAAKETKLYEIGTLNYDGITYNEVFTKNVLVSDVCS